MEKRGQKEANSKEGKKEKKVYKRNKGCKICQYDKFIIKWTFVLVNKDLRNASLFVFVSFEWVLET